MARSKKPVDPVEAAFAAFVASQGAAKELTDGAIRCSIPGCGGIVKPAFILPKSISAEPIGLCPQKELHQKIAAKNPAAKVTQGRLLTLYRASRV